MKKWRIAGAVILAVLLALFCASQVLQAVNVQNVFDEMYYGHEDVSDFYFLYPATYRGYGLRNIPDMTRYLLDGIVLEYLSDSQIDNGEVLGIKWKLNEQKITYGYKAPLPRSESYRISFIAEYNVQENRLVISPVLFLKDKVDVTHELPSILKQYSLSGEDIEQLFNKGFMERITNRWFEVNKGQSRFNKDDFGELTVENHMFDDFPEMN